VFADLYIDVERLNPNVRFLLEHCVNDSEYFTLGQLKLAAISPDLPGGFGVVDIDEICQNNCVKKEIETDIIRLSKAVINQNYFRFLGKTFAQNDGLAMGAPTSSIFSEIYLQSL
jgi:hypothetical protein